jgi:hypothetical protein
VSSFGSGGVSCEVEQPASAPATANAIRVFFMTPSFLEIDIEI